MAVQTDGGERAATPEGRRAFDSLRPADRDHLGEEAGQLGRLARAGLPLASGWLVRLGEAPEQRLESAVRDALAAGGVARLRPLLPTVAAARRLEADLGTPRDVESEAQVDERVRALLEVLRSPRLLAAVGGSLAAIVVRVIACELRPSGRAASADPAHGDPDEVVVWATGASAARWSIDRRTMRVTVTGEGIDADRASRVADLADRAQLALGHPVELEWCTRGERLAVHGVRSLELKASFARCAWRRVALVAADEGTVAPLAVDCLDVALGREDELGAEPHVRRVYARPYRRWDGSRVQPGVRPGGTPASLAKASVRAARVASDVAAPLAAARGFRRGLDPRLAALDAVDLGSLEDAELLGTLRERQRLVAEALVLLDRGREASLTVLAAIETAVGPLPRQSVPALAAPKRVRARRRVHERMRRLARRIEDEVGELLHRSALPLTLQRRWDELRSELEDVRPLGIDVRPDAYGASDVHLLEALRSIGELDDEAVEVARRDAVRRLLVTARNRSLGHAREAIAAPLTVVAARVAHSKGAVSEGLASALLRLRRAACEAGRRLAELGVVEEPEDALYLYIAEIEEGLGGEPGAYAARVRLRREDGARWARFAAPRRIRARERHGARG